MRGAPTWLWIALLSACARDGAAARGARAPASSRHTAGAIHLRSPAPGELVRCPVEVRGEARGSWFFEATFPVSLVDDSGRALSQGYAQAQGEWMTTAFVPFEATLACAPTAAATGSLRLEKANPSGLPEHAAELRVPVRFGPRGAENSRGAARVP